MEISYSRNPQCYVSSESMKRMLETHLWCYCSFCPTDLEIWLPSAAFSYNSAISSDLGVSNFEFAFRWTPKSPMELVEGWRDCLVESACGFMERQESSFQDAVFGHKLAKTKQSSEKTAKCLARNYAVRDKMWVSRWLYTDAFIRAQKKCETWFQAICAFWNDIDSRDERGQAQTPGSYQLSTSVARQSDEATERAPRIYWYCRNDTTYPAISYWRARILLRRPDFGTS